ncbi:MAG: acetylornithine deacetylase [Rhodobacteraceae bacterium]|nr:acetylornithine deacetylase [Paracoccaceae bacterium]
MEYATNGFINSRQLLERLIAFNTVSRDSNLKLIDFVRRTLADAGIASRLVFNDEGTKANLFASVGPDGQPGIMLSGHTDVVPVDGQQWSCDPFALTERDGLLHGRGSADMKGFIACALRAMLLSARISLATPLWLCLSYDEEVGCIGVRRMISLLADEGMRPRLCIVGEPTSMKVAIGHKGKTALTANCVGRGGHTAMAPNALNALHLACDFVAVLRRHQRELAANGPFDRDFDIPYTTIHAARIRGGIAPNIVPERSAVEFEIRNIASHDCTGLLAALEDEAGKMAASVKNGFPEAEISLQTTNSYPGLDTKPGHPAVAFVKSLVKRNDSFKVAFGTEGGLFDARLDAPVVICGPGSMEQGHKADEFVSINQIGRCDAMMDALVERLRKGV